MMNDQHMMAFQGKSDLPSEVCTQIETDGQATAPVDSTYPAYNGQLTIIITIFSTSLANHGCLPTAYNI